MEFIKLLGEIVGLRNVYVGRCWVVSGLRVVKIMGIRKGGFGGEVKGLRGKLVLSSIEGNI